MEYQFIQEKLDEATTRAISAFRSGNKAAMEIQLRIIAFWQNQMEKEMEVHIYEA